MFHSLYYYYYLIIRVSHWNSQKIFAVWNEFFIIPIFSRTQFMIFLTLRWKKFVEWLKSNYYWPKLTPRQNPLLDKLCTYASFTLIWARKRLWNNTCFCYSIHILWNEALIPYEIYCYVQKTFKPCESILRMEIKSGEMFVETAWNGTKTE